MRKCFECEQSHVPSHTVTVNIIIICLRYLVTDDSYRGDPFPSNPFFSTHIIPLQSKLTTQWFYNCASKYLQSSVLSDP